MIQVNELAFVHYPVTDKARAREFYEGVLGLKGGGSDFPDGFWLEYELGAATLALSSFWKPSEQGSKAPAAALEVEDFDQTIADLKTRQTPFEMEPYESPVCRMAIVLDPDGNALFIHKRNPGRS